MNTNNMKAKLLLATLLASGAACAQTLTTPIVLKSPNEFRIVSQSGNGKWACGVYADDSDERYGFLWNLESGEIEMLDAANPSIAYSVSDNGIVVGQYTDNTYRKNGASVTLAGYWANHKWNRLEMPISDANYANAYSISPNGRYITGVVQKGDVYSGYVWKDFKIDRALQGNNKIAMPYAISPDGQTVAGWAQDDNRSGCIWDAEGNLTFLNPEYQSPWSSGRKFSHDGKKLLYYGGYVKVGDKWGVNTIYDVATGEKTAMVPEDDDFDNLDVFDISDDGTIACENAGRGYIYQNGKYTYADDYLKEQGLDLSTMHIFVDPDNPNYYQIYRTATVSADNNVMGFQYYNDDKDDKGEYSISVQSMVVKFNQNPTGLCPASVTASQLAGIKTVRVEWKANIAAQGITGYNVYRDGTKLNATPLTGSMYLDQNVANGSHTYAVTALYGSTESDKTQAAALSIADKGLSTPEGLFAQQHGYNDAYVEWSEPYTNYSSLKYINPNNTQIETFGLGLANYSYETAVKFDSAEVASYKGQKIMSVGIYPLEAQGGWKINLYTHLADGTLKCFYTQPVTQSLNYGARNVVKLNTPQDLPAGDLIIAQEVAVTTPSGNINALDYGRNTEGYSDLIRLTTEADFYSINESMQQDGYMYPATWLIDATIAPADANLSKDDVKNYNVYADGTLVGTSATPNMTLSKMETGTHTIGVSAVYADGSESAKSTTTLDITPDTEILKGVEAVSIAPNANASVTASWEAPVAKDKVELQYCSGEASTSGITGPQDNNYGIMVSALYPSKTFRGRKGYTISAARFYPLSEASYIVQLYKNGTLMDETFVDDYTVGQWNEVPLTNPVEVDDKVPYQLVVICDDVLPKSPTIAIDKNDPVTGYSDLYSLDGSSWNPLSSTGAFANWMIGLRLDDTNGNAVPVEGYDVTIDGDKKNTAKLTGTSFTYDFGKSDASVHTIYVDTYYSVSPTSIEGGLTRFYLDGTGISDNVVSRIEVRKGDNEITVKGDNVTSVELVSAAGATVASAKGNTVSLNGIAAGVYVVKAKAGNDTVTRKIMIEK